MNQTAFVTGGAGFIGATLVRKLLQHNYNVHLAVRRGGDIWRIQDIQKKLTLHEALLEDPVKLKKTLYDIQPQAIFHFSTYGAYPSQENLSNLVNVNVTNTLHLLETVKDLSYQTLVVAGSSSEYGKKDKPMNEMDLLEPNNYYGALKSAQTYLCQAYAKKYTKPVSIFRLFNVYGPYEEKGRLVRNVIEAALRNKPIALATGKEARDFIYVEDIVDACLQATTGKTYYGDIFNIGTGIQTTIEELAALVIKLTKSKSDIQRNVYPGRPWDAYTWIADTQRTSSVLGWRHRHTLAIGLKKTIEWYIKNI